MTFYIKDGVIKPQNQIIVYTTITEYIETEEGQEEKIVGMQTINPSHDLLIENGWVEYVEPEITLEQIKDQKISEITDYDKSSEVNIFYVSQLPMWLSREERIVIKDRFSREVEEGKSTTKLRYNGLAIELDPLMGIQMINALSSYADACFDVTEDHKANVRNLTTKEEVSLYDHTIGYPEKLKFDI